MIYLTLFDIQADLEIKRLCVIVYAMKSRWG